MVRPFVVLVTQAEIERELVTDLEVILHPEVMELLADVQVGLTRDSTRVAASHQTEQETGERMPRAGKILRVSGGDIVESEVEKYRVVNGADT